MKTAGILIGAIIAIIAIVVIGSYISAYNRGNSYEARIIALYDNNRNILSNYHAKIQELVQVPSMYKDDFKEVVTSAMQSRYGANGSKAVFQFLKEHQINFDASLYKSIMQNIEAGRNDFANAQTVLIDIKRAYTTDLGSLWTGFWMKMAGYPRIDLSKYDIVVTEKTQAIFDTKKDVPLKLR